jgi:hypothetical protein
MYVKLPTQAARRFAAALLDQMANAQQATGESWSTQRLQDAIDSLKMDYDGDVVEMVARAEAESLEDEP